MTQFLVVSLVASVALTVALNVALRARPGAGPTLGERAALRLEEQIAGHDGTDEPRADRSAEPGTGDEPRPRVQVFFPWKAMLAISAVLTALVNIVPLLFG